MMTSSHSSDGHHAIMNGYASGGIPIQQVPVDGLSAVAADHGYGPASNSPRSPRSNPMNVRAAFITDGTTTGTAGPTVNEPGADAYWQNINQLLHNSMDVDVEVNYNQLNQVVTNVQNNYATLVQIQVDQTGNIGRLEAEAERMVEMFQTEAKHLKGECQVWYNNAQLGHQQAEMYAAATTHLGIRAAQELQERDRKSFEYEEAANYQGREAWKWESAAQWTYTQACEEIAKGAECLEKSAQQASVLMTELQEARGKAEEGWKSQKDLLELRKFLANAEKQFYHLEDKLSNETIQGEKTRRQLREESTECYALRTKCAAYTVPNEDGKIEYWKHEFAVMRNQFEQEQVRVLKLEGIETSQQVEIERLWDVVRAAKDASKGFIPQFPEELREKNSPRLTLLGKNKVVYDTHLTPPSMRSPTTSISMASATRNRMVPMADWTTPYERMRIIDRRLPHQLRDPKLQKAPVMRPEWIRLVITSRSLKTGMMPWRASLTITPWS